jgi:hypothetical protein
LAIIIFCIIAVVGREYVSNPYGKTPYGKKPYGTNTQAPKKAKYVMLKKVKNGNISSSIAMQKIRLNTTMPSSNLLVSASSSGSAASPIEVINYADQNTFWVSSASSADTEWIKIELKEPAIITKIDMENYKGPIVREGTLETYPYANRLKGAELTIVGVDGEQIYLNKFDNAPFRWSAIP